MASFILGILGQNSHLPSNKIENALETKKHSRPTINQPQAHLHNLIRDMCHMCSTTNGANGVHKTHLIEINPRNTLMTNDTLIHFVVNLCPLFFCRKCSMFNLLRFFTRVYIFVIWSNFSFQISLLQTYQFLGDDNFAGCGTWLKPLSVRLTQISHLDHHMVWFCDIFVFQPQNKRSPKCSPSIKLVLWVAVQLTWYKDKLLLFTSSTSNIQSAKWPIRTLFVDLRDTLPCQPGQNQDERSENDLFSYFFAQVTKRNEITKLILWLNFWNHQILPKSLLMFQSMVLYFWWKETNPQFSKHLQTMSGWQVEIAVVPEILDVQFFPIQVDSTLLLAEGRSGSFAIPFCESLKCSHLQCLVLTLEVEFWLQFSLEKCLSPHPPNFSDVSHRFCVKATRVDPAMS